MRSKKTAILIVSVFLLVFIIQPNARANTNDNKYSSARNYDRTYTFYVQNEYRWFSMHACSLYVSVPPSLYDYYRSKTHSVLSEGGYSKFVTPNAVRSIAENIQNVTSNAPYSDEQFANAVLKVVHQIPYAKSNAKYPVEAIVDNSGDCDVLSYLAASIMKAGGLDVVLLHYKERSPTHMNVGVYLPHTPVYSKWWIKPKGYEYNGKEYWVAECTSKGNWKVGDQPDSLADAKAWIVSLETCEESSPAHVSSSLDNSLAPSSISINLSLGPSNVEDRVRTFNISGSISPAFSGQRVIMYVTQDGSSSKIFGTVFTDSFGNYSLTWNFTSTGTYYIRTSWSGFLNYSGSDSETLTVFVGFYKPLVEFEVPEYYWDAGPDYTSSRASAAAYYGLISQGVKEFLEINFLGDGLLLSGQFIILRSEKTITRSERTITIPSYEKTYRIPRSRRTITITVPEQTITIPSYEQTPKNHLGLILRHNGGNNYSVSVRKLNDYNISQTTKQLEGKDTAFINASMGTTINTWYKVVAKMSKEEITVALYHKNGTLVRNITTGDDAISISELEILMPYDPDTVIAFKNLKVETVDQSTQPVSDNHIPICRLEWRRGG